MIGWDEREGGDEGGAWRDGKEGAWEGRGGEGGGGRGERA